MSDNFVERYFANFKQDPLAIKKDYEETVGDKPQPGVRVIKDTCSRYSAVYTDEESATSYLVNEFDEFAMGDFPAGKTEVSYADCNGNFVNVGERRFFSGITATMTYSGFTIDKSGEVANLNAENAKNTFDQTTTAIESIREMQKISDSTTLTTPTIEG